MALLSEDEREGLIEDLRAIVVASQTILSNKRKENDKKS